MVTGILLIVIGALIGMFAGKLLSGTTASIVSLIGWICSVLGIIYLIVGVFHLL